MEKITFVYHKSSRLQVSVRFQKEREKNYMMCVLERERDDCKEFEDKGRVSSVREKER